MVASSECDLLLRDKKKIHIAASSNYDEQLRLKSKTFIYFFSDFDQIKKKSDYFT